MATNAAAQNAIKKKLVHRLEVGFGKGQDSPPFCTFWPVWSDLGSEGLTLIFLSSMQPNKPLQLPRR